MKMIKAWYQQPSIQYELIKQLKNKEFVVLTAKNKQEHHKKLNVRNMRCHNTQSLQFYLKALNFYTRPEDLQFYASVATYKEGVPFTTMNFKKRDHTDWKEEHWKHIKEFPLFIDIDAPSHEDLDLAYEATKNIKKEFDAAGFPYTLTFSGMGFHFMIRQCNITPKADFDPRSENCITATYEELAKTYYEDKTEFVDLNVYDMRRIHKLPYSLAHYDDGTYICWNFHSNQEFDNFTPEQYKLKDEKHIKHWARLIYKRGVHLFNA